MNDTAHYTYPMNMQCLTIIHIPKIIKYISGPEFQKMQFGEFQILSIPT